MYFRARYYSPQLGQFISRDPLGYVDGMSQYRAYFVPDGMDPEGLVSCPAGFVATQGPPVVPYKQLYSTWFGHYKKQKTDKLKWSERERYRWFNFKWEKGSVAHIACNQQLSITTGFELQNSEEVSVGGLVNLFTEAAEVQVGYNTSWGRSKAISMTTPMIGNDGYRYRVFGLVLISEGETQTNYKEYRHRVWVEDSGKAWWRRVKNETTASPFWWNKKVYWPHIGLLVCRSKNKCNCPVQTAPQVEP